MLDSLLVVHVSTQRGWHGGEEQARLLCEGLQARGHRNVIFARHDGQFAEGMARAGYEVRLIPGGGRGLRAILAMRSWLRQLKPNVLHLHDPHALSGCGLAAMGLGIPARVVARRVDFPIRSAWRYRRLVDRVLAVSTAVAKVCEQSGVPAEKLRVVHDGVDPLRAQSGKRHLGRASLDIGTDTPLVVTVATLTDHKGHTYLLQALPEVKRHLPNVVVALAGDGELRDSLEAEAKRLGVEGSVRFLGYRHDIPDLIKAADLFVLPSHLEGLGSSLIDVMFARTPIVATRTGGIPDLLEGVAGLVPPRDPPALAEAIVQTIGDRSLVDRAESRALADFTAERMVEKTLAAYEEILARR